MAVTRIEVRARRPLADGRAFGDAGAYERVDGVLHFAADPLDDANREIVLLTAAARDPQGLVRFDADFCLLQPVDPGRGDGKLLFDILNRGRRVAVNVFNGGEAPPTPTDTIDPHDGWLFRQGWSLAWCGWQWDVPRAAVPGIMSIDVPQASDRGRRMAGAVRVEATPYTRTQTIRLCDTLGTVPFRPYAAADIEQADAVMVVRDGPNAPVTEVPRARWRFAHNEGGTPVPDPLYAWLDGGFEAGRTYQVYYRTMETPVVGAGLLATRDAAAFLRYGSEEDGNPAAGRLAHTYAFGASQSGRFLRTFLYHGLNLDEAGRQVFDGMHIHIAGARRGEFNAAWGQSSVEGALGVGFLPPYSLGGDAGLPGLLDRQRALGGVPKLICTNTAIEYWRGDAALLHVSADGQRDLALPAEARAYAYAGTQHSAGVLPPANTSPLTPGLRANHLLNLVDHRPLTRAALANLERWVAKDVAPPDTAVPRLSDGTGVTRESVLGGLPAIPGLHPPAVEHLATVPARLDLGPEAVRGFVRWPARAEGSLAAIVSAADSDGNEVAGIRLPDVSVPVATNTGWNTRHPETGGARQALRLQGATIPFAPDASARGATADPRPSIAERYASRDDYAARVREAAESLAARGHLLRDDVGLVVASCLARYDAVLQQTAPSA